MQKYQKFIFLILFQAALASLSQSRNINPRLMSLGDCQLVFSDRDNDLNGYDFGNNPAALFADQKQMWMAARLFGNHTSGEFRRPLDPKSQTQVRLQAEGIKPINHNSVFRGFIQYATEELHEVDKALEYEPYHDIFTPIDTTRGTFDYYGPRLGMEYSRQLFSWLAIGGRIAYQLQDGLKREPSKTKIDGRMIHGTLGAYLTPNQRLGLGLAYRPFSIQYRLNANKSFLLDYPIIYKFFGDSLLVKNDKVGTYDRTTRGEGFMADASIAYQLSESIALAGAFGYSLEDKKIDEGSSEGQRDIDDYGSWQKNGPWAKIQSRMRYPKLPATLGLSLDWRSWNSWARTPRFQTIFEEMEGGWLGYGLGVGLDKPNFPVSCGFEYHAQSFEEEKRNYYQNYKWNRQNTVRLYKFGCQLRLRDSITLRLGGATGDEVAEYHLSFQPVRVLRMSAGMSTHFKQLHFDLTALYERIRHESGDGEREQILMILEVVQWK
ncbi:hypothetical protein JXJ21_26525 [candidate division KSB1 bacterium]|nr:hypothetical protein [candidate division KSB1 bacterium]